MRTRLWKASLAMGHSFDTVESECRFAIATRIETISPDDVGPSAAYPCDGR